MVVLDISILSYKSAEDGEVGAWQPRRARGPVAGYGPVRSRATTTVTLGGEGTNGMVAHTCVSGSVCDLCVIFLIFTCDAKKL
jgi:hypothetical protein